MTLVRLEGGTHDGKVVDAHGLNPVVANVWIGREEVEATAVALWNPDRHWYEVTDKR